MTQDLRLKWAAALRSGEYKQGKGILCSGPHYYCCLGVLAKIQNALGETPIAGLAMPIRNTYQTNTLPSEYRDKWGLSLAAHDKLIIANDTLNWTFDQIADAVEAGNILNVEI